MTRFPAGQLPPVNKVTQRDPAEIEALLKGRSRIDEYLTASPGSRAPLDWILLTR
jgi:hypothetical protein